MKIWKTNASETLGERLAKLEKLVASQEQLISQLKKENSKLQKRLHELQTIPEDLLLQQSKPDIAEQISSQLLTTIEYVYWELKQQLRSTHIALPDLYEKVHQQLSSLSIEEFQAALKMLRKQRKIKWHITDATEVPDENFAIPSAGGMAYYISWRSDTKKLSKNIVAYHLQELVHQMYREYCLQLPTQKPIAIKDFYEKVQEKTQMPLTLFQNILLGLEKDQFLQLIEAGSSEETLNSKFSIKSRRGLLSYIVPRQKSPQDLVYEISKDMVQRESSVSLPRLLKCVRELVPITEDEFAEIITNLHGRLVLREAESEEQGGICIEGIDYFYVTEVNESS